MIFRIALVGTVVALSATAALAETTAAEVTAACNSASNLPAAICTCMGERAIEDLNDAQRALLVAGYTGDAATAAATRAGMPAADLIGMATFATDAPLACMRAGQAGN